MYAKFLLATTLIALSAFGQKATGVPSSHGTINIFLANQNGLVALTDSRLSYNGRPVERGQKLFKVDDHTICAVAGFYMDDGAPLKRADGQMLYPAYTSISDILRDYFRANPSPIDLNRLASALTQSLNFVATVDKINGRTDKPAESEITLAGYRDGILYISQLSLIPMPVNGQIEYQVKPQEEKVVKSGLIFATAGLDHIAQSSLNNPKEATSVSPYDGRPLKTHDPMMEKLNKAMSKTEGANLSIEELTELARDLEDKTAKAYSNEVGDDVETAVLFDGHVQTFQQPVGEQVNPNKFSYSKLFGAGGSGVGFGGSYWIMEYSSLAETTISLDGSLFLGDSFSGCHLIYRGTAEAFFDPSNAVVDSELDIGPSVPDDDPFVVRMRKLYPRLDVRRFTGN